MSLDGEERGGPFRLLHLDSEGRVSRGEHRDPCRSGNRFLEQFQPLPRQHASEHDAGDIPAGSSQAGSQPQIDRILTTDDEDDSNRLGRRLGGPNRGGTARDDDVDVTLDELGRERWEPFDAAFGVASLDLQVPALDVAQVLQNHDDIATRVVRAGKRRHAKIERAKPVHLPRLLGVGGELRT